MTPLTSPPKAYFHHHDAKKWSHLSWDQTPDLSFKHFLDKDEANAQASREQKRGDRQAGLIAVSIALVLR